MITIKNLGKSFKKHDVFLNFNLEIQDGDIILIRGKNGCGKSTLLKIIADLMKYEHGEIVFDRNYNIGALIENPAFLDQYTLKYNLLFLCKLRNDYSIEYLKELCNRFQIDFESKQKMKYFSIGMRQKAGIIQAIMEKQDLILLDEPTRGLDEEALIEFNSLIKELSMSGKSILIASHDPLKNIAFTKVIDMS